MEILQALVGRVPFLSNAFTDSHSEIEAAIRDPKLAFQSVITFLALLTAARRNVSVSFLVFHAVLLSSFRQMMQYQ